MEKIRLNTVVDDLKTEGWAERRDLDSSERVQRAMKIFGICFGAGCLTVFVPILHFILPPLFLIAGCIFATTTYLENGRVLAGEVTCPNCKRTMQLQEEAEEWPKKMRCEGCSFTLQIEPAGLPKT